MTPQLKYRGRKPRHARDPLAVRPAECRAATEPRIPLVIPRGVILDLLARWKRYRRTNSVNEGRFLPVVIRAMPYLDRVANKELPIAGELPLEATWTGWLMLVEFAMAVKATEFATRVIPILSRQKYHAEAEDEPRTDEFSDQVATFAATE